MTSREARVAGVIAELRGLPDGLETPVCAGLLLLDVLRATGMNERALAELAPEMVALERQGIVPTR